MTDRDELVTAAEAASRLGVGRDTIYGWLRRRQVRIAKTSDEVYRGQRTYLFRWGDILDCKAQRDANAKRYQSRQ
jgi:excisionase family DNA binding protein